MEEKCHNHCLTEAEVHENCTVQILRCPACGEVSIGWWPNDQPPVTVLNTED